jgi:hypothetical protein
MSLKYGKKKEGLYLRINSFKCLLALLFRAPLMFQERIDISKRASIERWTKRSWRGRLRNHVFLPRVGSFLAIITDCNISVIKHFRLGNRSYNSVIFGQSV